MLPGFFLTSHVGILLAGTVLLTTSAFAQNQPQPHSVSFRVGVAIRNTDLINETVSSAKAGIETAKIIFTKQNPHVRLDLKYYSHDRTLDSVSRTGDQIVNDNIPAIIGGELTEEALLLGQKLNKNGSVLISPTSSHPDVTKEKSFVFGMNLSDDATGEQIANYTISNLLARRIGIVKDISSPYTNYLATKVIESIKSASNTPDLLVEEKIFSNTSNFDAISKKFKNLKIQHVIMITRRASVFYFSIQSAEISYFPILVGCDGWGTAQSIHSYLVQKSRYSKNFVGYVPAYWDGNYRNELSREFQKTYEKYYKSQPDSWAIINFETAWVLFDSILQSKNPNSSESIRSALLKYRTDKLITLKDFKFNANRRPQRILSFYRIDRGGIKLETHK